MKTAAISPFFKIAGDLPLFIVSFKKSQIYAEKISAFSFKVLAGISVVYSAFLPFNLLIFLKTPLTLTSQKEKTGPFLAFLMAMIPGWFSYLSIALKIGWGIFSARELESLNSGIFRFFTARKKKEFRISTLSLSSLIPLLSSTVVIFSFDFDLSESNGLTLLQNSLLSAVSMWFRLA